MQNGTRAQANKHKETRKMLKKIREQANWWKTNESRKYESMRLGKFTLKKFKFINLKEMNQRKA